jgi:methylmalonyl-CoA decarboxylase subunit alpha
MSAGGPGPADWQPEVDELAFRRAQAEALGGAAAVAKHHERGRLTIRERIGGLVDADSFREVGTLTGQGRYAVTPAPYVMGWRRSTARPVGDRRRGLHRARRHQLGRRPRKGGQGGFVEDLATSTASRWST